MKVKTRQKNYRNGFIVIVIMFSTSSFKGRKQFAGVLLSCCLSYVCMKVLRFLSMTSPLPYSSCFSFLSLPFSPFLHGTYSVISSFFFCCVPRV
ncbi:hypothetical protein B0F90DRAFT_1759251, partial [Multifurca ochricompacta]